MEIRTVVFWLIAITGGVIFIMLSDVFNTLSVANTRLEQLRDFHFNLAHDRDAIANQLNQTVDKGKENKADDLNTGANDENADPNNHAPAADAIDANRNNVDGESDKAAAFANDVDDTAAGVIDTDKNNVNGESNKAAAIANNVDAVAGGQLDGNARHAPAADVLDTDRNNISTNPPKKAVPFANDVGVAASQLKASDKDAAAVDKGLGNVMGDARPPWRRTGNEEVQPIHPSWCPTIRAESGNSGDAIGKRRRAIVYSCDKLSICGGWADRQKGIVSGYVLSVLLDRDFKLDMPRPCDVSVFLSPNEVDWILTPEEKQSGSRSDVEGIDSHGYDLVNRMLKVPDLNIPEMDADHVFITWNMELVHLLRKHSLARHVPWLALNISLAEIYSIVLKKLFCPSMTLRSRVEDLMQARPPDTKLACAQIRMGGSKGFNDSETFNSLEGVRNLVGFLHQYNDPAHYRIMFASDNVQALKLGKEAFPDTFMESTGPITHVDKYKGKDACAGFGRAILDQLVLSTCDVLVISESGLGKIAAFLRNSDDGLYLLHDSKISSFRRDLRFPNRFFW